VLSLLVGGFSFSMYVETQVASFSRKELKAAALARSGVELARLQIASHFKNAAESQFTALNQSWAVNDDYRDRDLGGGKINITVTDESGLLPINKLTETQIRRLMHLLDVNLLEADTLTDSILDWITPGDLHRLNGAKTDFYQQQPIPYACKSAPLDRVEELLLVRGVTPDLYNGIPATAKHEARPGLKSLFTALTTDGHINVNTASDIVLQTMLGLDGPRVGALLELRDGPDGVPGTKDDQPFRSTEEFLSQFAPADGAERELWQRVVAVNSTIFRVTSVGEVSGVKRTITAVLVLNGADTQFASWTEQRGGQP